MEAFLAATGQPLLLDDLVARLSENAGSHGRSSSHFY
jgi:hypothetical protein